MSGDIVNLKRRRKRLAREGREAQAEENRRRFDKPKAERERDEAERRRAERAFDRHKREE